MIYEFSFAIAILPATSGHISLRYIILVSGEMNITLSSMKMTWCWTHRQWEIIYCDLMISKCLSKMKKSIRGLYCIAGSTYPGHL